jgi:hypothetical protein
MANESAPQTAFAFYKRAMKNTGYRFFGDEDFSYLRNTASTFRTSIESKENRMKRDRVRLRSVRKVRRESVNFSRCRIMRKSSRGRTHEFEGKMPTRENAPVRLQNDRYVRIECARLRLLNVTRYQRTRNAKLSRSGGGYIRKRVKGLAAFSSAGVNDRLA